MPRAVSSFVVTGGCTSLTLARIVVRAGSARASAVAATSSVRPGVAGTTTTRFPSILSVASCGGVAAGRSRARPEGSKRIAKPLSARPTSKSARNVDGARVYDEVP
jgi:hypothetical protein